MPNLPDRPGPIGGLIADRPLLSMLVVALGLTALASLAAADAPHFAGGLADFAFAALAIAVAPLALAAAAPRRMSGRIVCALLVAGAAVAWTFAPFTDRMPPWTPAAAAGFAAVGIASMLMNPLFGAARRFAFIAPPAALLGAAGAFGLGLARGEALSEGAGAIAALALAAGAAVGLGALFDFSSFFARGADPQRAAGLAARAALAPTAFAAACAAGAVAVLLGLAGDVGAGHTAAFAVAATAFAAIAAVITACSALALRKADETLAVEENRRIERFRRSWRALRRRLRPSAALATLGIVAIAALASTFAVPSPPLDKLAFAAAAAAAGAAFFSSVRTGLFLLAALSAQALLVDWLWAAVGGAALRPLDEAAALAVAAILLGQMGLAWRDARSPRLNARETTEAAMGAALARNLLLLIAAGAAFSAADIADVWPNGVESAAYLAALDIAGVLLAPALMTSLTHAVRRELN